jgi:hypothetical protein
MADGIRINDAALEIPAAGVSALVNREGADVRVTRLDISISPEALAALVAGLAPEGTTPTAETGDGSLKVSGEKDGKRVGLELRCGALRLEIKSDGLRLVSE